MGERLRADARIISRPTYPHMAIDVHDLIVEAVRDALR